MRLFLFLLSIFGSACLPSAFAEEDPFEDLIEEEEGEAEDFENLKYSIFFEAEELPGVEAASPYKAKGDWQVAYRIPNETSRKCLTNHKLTPILRKIRIPASATYNLWIRYRLASGKRAPFSVRITQKGKKILENRFYGFRLQASGMAREIQKEHDLWFDIPGMQEGVFAGEEWAWERVTSELPEGEATLTIEPLRRSAKHPLLIDCVFLTASMAYRPKFSDFKEVWVRYRPVELEPKNSEYKVSVDVQWLRPVMLNGVIQIHAGGGILTGPKEQPLRFGQSSTWTELYDELKYGHGYCTTTFHPQRNKSIRKVTAEIDVGWGPREGQILRTIREVADVGPAIGISLPTEHSRKPDEVVDSVWPTEFRERVRTFTDMSKDRNKRIAKLIPEPVGKSKYFNFCTAVSAPGGSYASTEIFRLELQCVSRMGINTLYGHSAAWIPEAGMQDSFVQRYYTANASPARYWVRHTCPNHPDNERAADAYMSKWIETAVERTGDADFGKHVFGMKVGDEIGISVNGEHVETCRDCQARFIQFLKTDGFDPARFGRTWNDVRFTGEYEAAGSFERRLRYYSVRFLSANTASIHSTIVAAARRHYSPDVPVLYNVNPTPVMGGMSGRSLNWFEMERGDGMNAQWMEVIGKPEPGRSSFLADLAWNICRRRNLPIGCYNLYVSRKRSARDTLAFIARGAKSFIYYSYGPRTLGAADNFSERDASILAVAEATGPIVAAEEYLHTTTRPPREVCMVYSVTAEILDEDSTVVRDRVFAYLALNHDQIPVDIISEKNVLEGRLSDYRVAYLNGEHLRRDVAEKIRDWVNAGGHVWADAGAATRDEADDRMDVLDTVFGGRQRAVLRKYPLSVGYYVAKTPDAEMGEVTWKDGPWGEGFSTPSILKRSVLELAEGKVVARFDDGSPAAVTHTFGKGKSMLLCYSAGFTYSRFYRTDKREQRYDETDRKVVSQFALDAGVRRPVRVSRPGVEATLLKSKKGLALSLLDQFETAPEVTIEFDLVKPPTSVRSVKNGELRFRHEDGKLSFDVKIENLDVVLVD